MKKKKNIVLFCFLCAACVLASAHAANQDIVVTAAVSQHQVTVGSRMTYTISIVSTRGMPNPSAVRMNPPVFGGLVSLTASPAVHRQTRTVNWETTNELKLQWTLEAHKEGVAHIEPVEIFYQEQRFEVPAFDIQVVRTQEATLPAALQESGILPANTDYPEINRQLAGRIFAKLILSEPNPYLQQTITATCVLYGDSLDILRQIQGITWAAPAWEGFFAEQADVGQLTAQTAELGGKPYQAVTIGQFFLTPTRIGKIEIPFHLARCAITVQNRRPSFEDRFFRDPFFDGFDSFFGTRIEIRLPMQEQTIEVRPLPVDGMPPSFQNAVGQFAFAANVDRMRITEDDLLTLSLEVGGEGYLGSVSQPKLPPLTGWREVGTQTKTESLGKVRSAGGKKTFEVLLRPEHAGKLVIPLIAYAFFDPQQQRYIEQTAGPFEIEVARGQEQKLIVADSRDAPLAPGQTPQFFGDRLAYIHTDIPVSAAAPLYRRPWYPPLQFLPLLIAAAAISARIARDYREKYADRLRVRAAGGHAKRGLKEARDALKRKDLDAFHARLAEALRAYIATKLSRSASGLTLEEIERGCLQLGATPHCAARFRALLEACEQARYLSTSPGIEAAQQTLREAEAIWKELDKAAFEK